MAILSPTMPSVALALCGEPQPRSVKAVFSNSHAVVAARLTRIRTVGEALDHLYLLTKTTTFRGDVPFRFRIWETNDSGRASFGWRVGEEYLLFMNYSKEDRAWHIKGCGKSGPTGESAAVIHAIRSIPFGNGMGHITGNVSEEALGDKFANALVVAKARGGRTFRTKTNALGSFGISVPPGIYDVSVSATGWTFELYLLSYEDSAGLHIESNGEAQIQFQAARAK